MSIILCHYCQREISRWEEMKLLNNMDKGYSTYLKRRERIFRILRNGYLVSNLEKHLCASLLEERPRCNL